MLRKALWKQGLRYRTHYKIKGSPDIVFPKKKLVVFCDGDFWHGYKWNELKKRLKDPFWHNKIKRNIQRDKEINKTLKKEGWKVMRIWEHQIRNNLGSCVKRIMKKLG